MRNPFSGRTLGPAAHALAAAICATQARQATRTARARVRCATHDADRFEIPAGPRRHMSVGAPSQDRPVAQALERYAPRYVEDVPSLRYRAMPTTEASTGMRASRPRFAAPAMPPAPERYGRLVTAEGYQGRMVEMTNRSRVLAGPPLSRPGRDPELLGLVFGEPAFFRAQAAQDRRRLVALNAANRRAYDEASGKAEEEAEDAMKMRQPGMPQDLLRRSPLGQAKKQMGLYDHAAAPLNVATLINTANKRAWADANPHNPALLPVRG